MEAFLLYSLKSAFAFTLLYVPYIFLLSRETLFSFNRKTLLLIVIAAIVLPWLNIPALAWGFSSAMQTVAASELVENAVIEKISTIEPHTYSELNISWMGIASWIYIIGVLAFLVWRLLGLYRLRNNIQRGCLWKEQHGHITIYCHAEEIAPYSWINNIVISEKDYQENAHKIITHEMGHIQARHSWDLLLLAAFQSFQWWNPIVYIFGNSLRDIHEYEADSHVLSQGISSKEYQQLLIEKVVGSNSYIFANNLCNSLTLKRIAMMQKKKSNTWMRSKVLYIVPVATLALSAFATSSSTSTVDTNVPNIRDKVIKKSDITQDTIRVVSYDSRISKSPQKAVTNDTSKVILHNGKRIKEEDLKSLDPKSIQYVNVIKNANAAKEMGYPGKSIVCVSTQDSNEPTKNGNQNLNIKHASYPGGSVALSKEISQVIKYPPIAQQNGIEGRVLLQLTIGKDGKIEKTQIQKSLSKECDRAAIEATKKLKRFTPAKENGQPVSSKYILPFVFRIQK